MKKSENNVKGAGRKFMYGEQTVRVIFSVPGSKVELIKQVVREKLKKYKTVQ